MIALRVLLVFVLVCGAGARATEEKRPNLLFAIAADWRWPHAGAYGCELGEDAGSPTLAFISSVSASGPRKNVAASPTNPTAWRTSPTSRSTRN